MLRNRNKRGFTMAETLIVVAIVIVLAAVAFVGVIRYQRTMTQLEYDGIAKEIFVAAQNHLTMAEEQGFLGVSKYGESDTSSVEGAEVYYFVYPTDTFENDSLLSLMLPFASVDETVRAGGSYIIRYQKSPALVLDVFYSSRGDRRFGTTFTPGASGNAAAVLGMGGDDGKSSRKNFGGKVVGWYGGESEVENGIRLDVPEVQIANGDILTVTVKNTNASKSGSSLRLIVTGETSGAQKYFDLTPALLESNIIVEGNDYTVVLDDITTKENRFSKRFTEDDGSGTFKLGPDNKLFQPGENIIVQAVAFYKDKLANVAYSPKQTDNSLFAAVNAGTAGIGSIRHLENLESDISGLAVTISGAQQTTDLSWSSFRENINKGKNKDTSAPVSIYYLRDGETEDKATADDQFYPISMDAALAYNGTSPANIETYHSITGITAATADEAAGLFGALQGGSVENLMLVDFNITSTRSSAGALAGTASGASVMNVAARNSTNSADVTVSGAGSVGGLIGESTNSTKVTACAAALVVESSGGNAGGLIGTDNGGTVKASYSGGHTKDGNYDDASYNVTGAAAAGGLVGSATGTTIEYSYSTCSVSGVTAGGLVGASTGSIANSYATGLVSGTTAGAFAGTAGTLGDGNYYYMIINENAPAADGSVSYMASVFNSANPAGVSALDGTAKDYNDFVGADWKDASAYDGTLVQYYQGKYNLKTVAQLDSSAEDKLVKTHYGDWPAPEIMIENEKNP